MNTNIQQTSIIPINYTYVTNNRKIFNNMLDELKGHYQNNNLKQYFSGFHGAENGKVFMVPKNVYIFFEGKSKVSSFTNFADKWISGLKNETQQILQYLHEGKFDNIKKYNRESMDNIRLYSPGGFILDYGLDANLDWPDTNRWMFSGIMDMELALNKIDETKYNILNINSDFKQHHETMLTFNDTSDFNIYFNPNSRDKMKTTLSDIVFSRKDKNKPMILFVSACRPSISSFLYNDCDELDNNIFNIPIPKPTRLYEDVNENDLSKAPKLSLRQRTLGFGNTAYETNYFWLHNEDIKDIILKHPKIKLYAEKNIYNENRATISNFCHFISQIIDKLDANNTNPDFSKYNLNFNLVKNLEPGVQENRETYIQIQSNPTKIQLLKDRIGFASNDIQLDTYTDVDLNSKNLTINDLELSKFIKINLENNRINSLNLLFDKLYGKSNTPLENKFNIASLNLSNNLIGDLNEQVNLYNIKKLVLGRNNIKNISPSINFKNLINLDLESNYITDINFLSNLKDSNLNYINLENNKITNIDLLLNVLNDFNISRKVINLKNNRISNIDGILEVIKNNKSFELNLNRNKIIKINDFNRDDEVTILDKDIYVGIINNEISKDDLLKYNNFLKKIKFINLPTDNSTKIQQNDESQIEYNTLKKCNVEETSILNKIQILGKNMIEKLFGYIKFGKKILSIAICTLGFYEIESSKILIYGENIDDEFIKYRQKVVYKWEITSLFQRAIYYKCLFSTENKYLIEKNVNIIDSKLDNLNIIKKAYPDEYNPNPIYITNLNLTKNNLVTDFDFEFDVGNNSLKELNLYSNKITSLNKIFNFKNLAKLDVSYNPLNNFNFIPLIKNLKSLNSLSLAGLNLKDHMAKLGEALNKINLNYLNLSDNNIDDNSIKLFIVKYLNKDIFNLGTPLEQSTGISENVNVLERLNLSKNKITDLTIFNYFMLMDKIFLLNIFDNSITSDNNEINYNNIIEYDERRDTNKKVILINTYPELKLKTNIPYFFIITNMINLHDFHKNLTNNLDDININVFFLENAINISNSTNIPSTNISESIEFGKIYYYLWHNYISQLDKSYFLNLVIESYDIRAAPPPPPPPTMPPKYKIIYKDSFIYLPGYYDKKFSPTNLQIANSTNIQNPTNIQVINSKVRFPPRSAVHSFEYSKDHLENFVSPEDKNITHPPYKILYTDLGYYYAPMYVPNLTMPTNIETVNNPTNIQIINKKIPFENITLLPDENVEFVFPDFNDLNQDTPATNVVNME